MIERLVVVAVLFAVGYVAYRLLAQSQLKKAHASTRNADPILQGLRRDVPTIVYFTTPMCIACETSQQPALNQLRDALGDAIQIVQVNAAENPDAAKRWGVMSAPTTFVLDATWQPQHVNNGVAAADLLKQQLAETHAQQQLSRVA